MTYTDAEINGMIMVASAGAGMVLLLLWVLFVNYMDRE